MKGPQCEKCKKPVRPGQKAFEGKHRECLSPEELERMRRVLFWRAGVIYIAASE